MTVLTPKGSPMCTSMHTCAERMLSFLCLVATRRISDLRASLVSSLSLVEVC